MRTIFGENIPILRKDPADLILTTEKQILITFMSIMNIFMFFGNVLCMVTIGYTAKLRKQVSYSFVMNLAIIDLLISVTVVPLNIVWEYRGTWPFSQTSCEFFNFADIAFSTISAYSIVLVSLDKYLYVTYAIHYHEKMTRKVSISLIIAVWVTVLIFTTVISNNDVGTNDKYKDHYYSINNQSKTCIFVMTDEFVIPSAIFTFFIPLCILCFTSARIICIASKHIKNIQSISKPTSSNNISDATIFKTCAPKSRRHTIATMTEISDTRYVSIDLTTEIVLTSLSINNDSYTNQNLTTTSSNSHLKVLGISEIVEKNHSDRIRSKFRDGTDNDKNTDCVLSYASGVTSISSHSVVPGSLVQGRESMQLPNIRPLRYYNNTDSMHDISSNTTTLKKASQQHTDDISSISLTVEKTNKKSMQPIGLAYTDSINSAARTKYPYCKLFGTVTIVIACFILMFAPFNIATVTDVGCRCIEPWVYEDILAVLYYMHSLVNPFIYMASDRKYKSALSDIWKLLKRKILFYKRNEAVY